MNNRAKTKPILPQGAEFLKMLHEDGIEEIYVEPKKSTLHRVATDPSRAAPIPPSTQAGSRNDTGLTNAKSELLALREKVLQCTLCQELAATRKSVVFGAGNSRAKLMFIGEAPGRDEDLQGLPFVGRAGQLLTKIIESIGLNRQQVFIANTLKCRPPQNRQPLPDEILNCQPFLLKQIELIQPKIICALGTFAAQTVLKTGSPISQLRGRFHDFQGTKVLCTFHPAYLLRNPGEKRKVWEDMKTIKKELDQMG